MLIIKRACGVSVLTIKKPQSVQWALSNDPFNYLKMMSDYQIMLWLIYKNFFLKIIDPDLQKQGHSVKPF